MAIGATRNLILGMAPKETILALADKIDQELGKNDNQEQKITELDAIKDQPNEEIEAIKKSQDIASCQKKKEDCKNKIYELENGELTGVYWQGKIMKGDRNEMIKKKEAIISEREKAIKHDTMDEDLKKQFLGDIKDAKKDIEKIKGIMTSEQAQKQALINGDCKDYQNPCE